MPAWPSPALVRTIPGILLATLLAAFPEGPHAQIVTVGKGSYTTALPAGRLTPQDSLHQPVVPQVTADFKQPAQTNEWWSSFLYKRVPNAHQWSGKSYPHPLSVRGAAAGLEMGYPDKPTRGMDWEWTGAGGAYIYPHDADLVVGIEGLAAPTAKTAGYSDWAVTADWTDGTKNLRATMAHGNPFVFFTVTGGPAKVAFAASPTVWLQEGGTLGVTVNGRHYGIFGPTGSAWTGSGQTRVSTLAGKNYLSVAVLPDGLADDAARKTALALFRAHAHAHVVSTRAAWTYDEKAARVTTTLTTTTVAREGTETRTLQALYRHQWLYSPTSLTAYTYTSPRGTMKLATPGNVVTTTLPFRGILPSFPDKGFDHAVLQGYLNAENDYEVTDGETYATGKKLARLAMLIPLADQLGNVPQRTALLGKLKAKLEAWFTASQGETGGLLYYNSKWNLLTGYPADFYSDTEVNDHHFHWSYFLMAASVVARYDAEWARTQNWGGMVELLIKDAANWDDSDARFPRLRNFDPYAGHSWAHGSEYYGRGNNQESSSEAMNFHTALFLWGLHTGNRTIRDLGAWMYANEAEATLQYWFDVDNAVFPDFFPNPNVGQVLSAGASYWTFFGETATFVHGINFLPLTTGSVYLARYPENLKANIDWMYNRPDRFQGKPGLWDDVIWGALAFADPQAALQRFGSFNSYAAFDGESKAHIYHMAQNLGALGRVQPGVLADAPSYTVFDKGGTRTYVVYNPDPTPRNVVFTDGATFEVPPRAMGSHTGPANPLGLARGGERLRGMPGGDRLVSGLEAIQTAARAWPAFSLHALDGKMVWSTASGVLPPDHIARGRLLLFRAQQRP